MKLIPKESAERREKGDEREIYQGEQLRVVVTRIPARYNQSIHRHDVLYDSTYVMQGEVVAIEETASGRQTAVLRAGDLVVFDPGPYHTLENRADEEALLLTVKFARQPQLTADDFKRLCIEDWHASPSA